MSEPAPATSEGCTAPKRLRISWSQISAYDKCAQMAMLRRKQKRSPATDIRNFFHGIVADRIMRGWLEEPNPQPGAMVERVDDYVVKLIKEAKENEEGVVKWRDPGDRARMHALVRRALERLEPMLVKYVLPYDYQPEYRFTQTIRIPYLDGSLADIEMIGGMDILVRRSEDPLHFYAHDLKITQDPHYVSKMLGQGVFYDLATFAEFGVPLQQFSFFAPAVEPPGQPVVPLNVSQEMRTDMLSRIVKYAHSRWREEHPPKASSEGCSWCDVKHGCEKFSTRASSFTPVPGRTRRGG